MPGLDLLWAPWRSKYIKSFSEKPSGEKRECVFCRVQRLSDEEALILYRGKHNYIIMNLYPYNAGHVMIVPYRHVPSLEDLSDEELLEAMKLVKLAMKAMRRAMSPDGFNVGVNVGRAAGAGIEEHVHIHVVPRWVGDANFMPVVAGVKVIPQDVKEAYKVLREAVSALIGSPS